MECRIVKSLLSQYLEGDLSQAQNAQVKEHLSTCKECAAELETLKRLVRDLGSLKKVASPGDLLEGIHRELGIAPKKQGMLNRIKIPLEATGVLVSIILVVLFINKSGILHTQKTRAYLQEQEKSKSEAARVDFDVSASREAFVTEAPVAEQGTYTTYRALPKLSAPEYSLGESAVMRNVYRDEISASAPVAPEQKMVIITSHLSEDIAKAKAIVQENGGQIEDEGPDNLYVRIPAAKLAALSDELNKNLKVTSVLSPATQETAYFAIEFSESTQ